MNRINIPLPQEVVATCIQANALQMSRGGESKCHEVEMLQYHVGEYVCGVVAKLQKKYLLK